MAKLAKRCNASWARSIITAIAVPEEAGAEEAAAGIAKITNFKSIRSFKTPKVTSEIGNSEFTRTTWSVNTRNYGGAAQAVYTKIKNAAGKTVRVYKDTYSIGNSLTHRKYKL